MVGCTAAVAPERRLVEHKRQPLLSRTQFTLRVMRFGLASAALIGVSLAIGAVGYHLTEHMRWLDSVYAAAMILTGMGPVGELKTDAGKIFATCYALLSALMLLSAATIALTPVLHRLLHRFHLEVEEERAPVRPPLPGRSGPPPGPPTAR